MLEFSTRHEADLGWYFSGGPAGDCGLKSSCGAQLEAIAATAQSDLTRAPEWSGRGPMPDQVVTCRPSRSGASPDSTEAATEALAAVRRERIVRAALSGIHPIEARVLAEFYVSRPEGSHTGLGVLGPIRGVVAYLAGESVRELARVAGRRKADGDVQERATAKARLRQYVAQARALVATARASYAAAADVAVRVERERRAARFAGGGA